MTELLAVGNWKMNTTVSEAVDLALAVRQRVEGAGGGGVRTVVCPPFVSLAPVKEVLSGSEIGLGAQNVYFEAQGAFTGEVSAGMLADLCQFVIIGHSERRHVLREGYQIVSRKLRAVVEAGLRPILCVGETLDQRQRDAAETVVRRQLDSALSGMPDPSGLVVAYEPVWAIGTGVPASPAAIVDITGGAIRAELEKHYGEQASLEVPVLYGGSVNPGNVSGFLEEPSIQGTLVGGASLDAEQFCEIVRLTRDVKGGS